MSRRAVFLDRDGVINGYTYDPETGIVDSPASPETFALLPGVGEAIGELNRMGLLVLVVSNQPGVAKGKFSRTLLQGVTKKMQDCVQACGARLDGVYYCLHHPEAVSSEFRVGCDCRKPATGLLRQAAEEWDVDLGKSYMVGDGVQDILAGKAVGATTIFLSPQKCYVCAELSRHSAEPHYMAEGLPAATQVIRELEGAGTPLAFPACRDRQNPAEICYTRQYCDEAISIIGQLDVASIEHLVDLLVRLR